MLGLGALALVVAACGTDDDVFASNTFAGGRILVAGSTGVLRGARVTVEQVEYLGRPPEVQIREHIDDVTTTDTGVWFVDGRQLSGQYRLTFAGGSFTDPATLATIDLDPADTLEAFIEVELATRREDYLITPVSMVAAAAARSRFATEQDERFGLSLAFAHEHVDRHFGAVDWQAPLALADLNQTATSPTDGVRAAWILGAIDILARDIAASVGASPNEVNPHALTRAWAADLGRADLPTFDGNDRDVRGSRNGGLSLGTECPIDPDLSCMAPPGCTSWACRPPCEVYSGTARVALAGALLSFARSDANRTGLPDSDALAASRAIQGNTDPVLFDPGACVEELDRVGPMLVFDEPPTPMASGFVRRSITVKASADDNVDPVPVVTFEDLPDQDGNPTDFQATTTIDTTTAGDSLTVRARAVDRAGNVTTIDRVWSVDNLDPDLTVDPTGFHVDGQGHWWILPPLTTGPTLSGTVVEANGATVEAYEGTTLRATATVTGAGWTLTLPPGTIATVTGNEIAIVASDPAGNTTTRTVRLRYDDAPPVIALVPTSVRDESADAIAFSMTIDPTIGNVPSYAPTHTHSGAAVALGATPAPACTTADAPTVTKHAYLLDEAPPAYAGEGGGSGPGGSNPLSWGFRLTDDGVGLDLAQTAYRVRDVASDAIVLDWQMLPDGIPILDGGGAVIGRAHTVSLYRVGTVAPSIPAITSDGLYEIQLRGRDQLGREVSDARCWNLRTLPSPIYVGPDSMTRQAESGPTGSGKYGFGLAGGPMPTLLSLADTSPPYDPIASQLLNDDAPGVGLVEFPMWNPTAEPVYVVLDLTRPTGATYTKEIADGYWAKSSESFTDIDCGYLAGPPASPNYTLPGCARYLGFPGPTVTTTPSTAVSAEYCVRVFEEVTFSMMAEVPCPTCATACAMPSTISRVVVQLPPRAGPPNPPAPPRKFWIMPVVKTIDELRPGGVQPYAEHVAGGQVLTGMFDSSQNLCGTHVYDSGTGTYRCTRRVTYRRYKATTRASLTLSAVLTTVRVSRDGLAILDPMYLSTNSMRERLKQFTPWSTAEPMLPLPPTAP